MPLSERSIPPIDEPFVVETHTHRRTALVALRGELDLVTITKVATVLDDLEPHREGVRHVVLDLRGVTLDVPALRELLRRNEHARENRHNLAVVQGSPAIRRLLRLTGTEDHLVLVDDPEDLVPLPAGDDLT